MTTLKQLTVAISAILVLGAAPGAQSNWIDFVDETAARVIADPRVTQYQIPELGVIGTPDASEFDMACGDLDRDGRDDVVISRKPPFYGVGRKIAVLLMNRAGRLEDHTIDYAGEFLQRSMSARDVQICDLNGDRWPDVIFGNTFGQDPEYYENQGRDATGWRGLERQSNWFVTEAGSSSFNGQLTVCSVGCGDIDRDGDVDLYLANYPWGEPWQSWSGRDRLLVNDGSGFLTEDTTARLTGGGLEGVSTGVDFVDLNGDLWPDYFLTMALEHRAVYNDRFGAFPLVQNDFTQSGSPYMHVPVDIDQDMRMDMYLIGDDHDVSILNQSTQGGVVSWSAGKQPDSLQTADIGGNAKVGDLDGDGLPDVGVADLDTINSSVASCRDGHYFVLLENVSDWSTTTHFRDPDEGNRQPWHVDGVWDFVILDVDSDGEPDLLLGHCGGLSLFIQQ